MGFPLTVVVKLVLLQKSVQHGKSSSRYFLPLLANLSLSMKSRGKVYSSFIWGILLHGKKCWALTNTDFKELSIMSMPWHATVMVSDRIATDEKPANSKANKSCLMVWPCLLLQSLDKQVYRLWSSWKTGTLSI